MANPIDYDVIIAGAGPAGSQAAIILSRTGPKVLVLEKGNFRGLNPAGAAFPSTGWKHFLPAFLG